MRHGSEWWEHFFKFLKEENPELVKWLDYCYQRFEALWRAGKVLKK